MCVTCHGWHACKTKPMTRTNSFSSNHWTDATRVAFSGLAISIWAAVGFAETVRAEEINSGTPLTTLSPALPAGEPPWNKGWYMLPFSSYKKLECASKHGAKGELAVRRETKRRRHEDAGEPVGWCMTSGAPTARRRWYIDQCPVQPTDLHPPRARC